MAERCDNGREEAGGASNNEAKGRESVGRSPRRQEYEVGGVRWAKGVRMELGKENAMERRHQRYQHGARPMFH